MVVEVSAMPEGDASSIVPFPRAPGAVRRFPRAVRDAMQAGGAAATCVPVQLDGSAWQAALFLQLAGPECKADRRIVSRTQRPLPVGIEADLIKAEQASVVTLRAEVYTRPDDPMVSEILLTPGAGSSHFEALKLLSTQLRLCWFFGDETYWLMHSQSHPLAPEQRSAFAELLDDATGHDAVVRLTGRYDAGAALASVAGHYELRAGEQRGRA